MQRRIVVLVVLFITALGAPTTLAQSQAAAPSAQMVLVAKSGTKDVFEISRARATELPRWDPAKAPEPPLSLRAARKAAETWLASQHSLIKTFDLSGVGLSNFFANFPIENCGPSGCWYYRLAFAPTLGDLPLTDNAQITVVVLLDGSIVWPRAEGALAARPVDPGGAATGDAAPAASAATPKLVPTPDANGVYRLGDGVWAPRIVRTVKPQYTAAAIRAKLEGTVALECVVKKDGTVGNVRVVRSLDADLDEEAIKAVKQWRFTPGTFRDDPVAVLATCQVEFKLR
ncbi:MAG: energy transducer TonB [Vicinamibacterales bacterium]